MKNDLKKTSSAQWEQIKKAFDAASRRRPDERAQVLDEVCGTDEMMRREVEALLASFDDAGGFMAKSIVSKTPEEATIEITPPARRPYLAHYEISEQIGAGGMGEVYLARDTRLDRLVALKVLSRAFIFDQEANQRLWREARAAATLDHPNICAIYEVGETNGFTFIVMQYIKGETLARQLERRKMSLREVLRNAVQVASALEEAHAHGIIHRDIKPANIIINEKGQVKVLDFGLAKFTEDVEAKTKITTAGPSSKAGVIMGTIPFMSPEQVRGQKLDGRTDIFSFGAMLYQMACGRQPFARDTDAETVSAILRDDPSWCEIPGELQPILRKCLMKNVDERYPTTADLSADLRELLRRLDVEENGRAGSEAVEVRPSDGIRHPSLRPGPAAQRFVNRWVIAATFALVGAAFLVLFTLRGPTNRNVPYDQITNFTDAAVSPALSPDGRMMAFLRSDNWFLTREQIYVKMLPNGEPVQVTHDARQKYGLAFSPDGARIAYTVVDAGPSQWKTFTVSPLGGEPSLLLSNAAGLTWLDERRVLFSELKKGPHMGVVTATESRSGKREIYFPQDERGMAHYSYASPDRKWMLVIEMNPVWQPCRLVPLDGSSAGRQVGPRGPCTSAAWSPDERWMYFGVEVEGKHHLWRQRFPAGDPEQITSGPTEEEGIAMAPDGRSLITSIGIHEDALWIHDARGERPLSSEGQVASNGTFGLFGSLPSFSRDGKSVFYLRSELPGGPVELWRADLASEKSEALLPGVSMLDYDLSIDEKNVVFSTQPAGKPSQVWLASLDRTSAPRLVSSSGEDSPHFGPGGEILYRFSDGKKHYLARMNSDGSGRTKVVPYPIGNVEYISPDKLWITTISPLPDGSLGSDGSTGGTIAVPIRGGAPHTMCLGCGLPVRWAPDGRFLYFVVGAPGVADTKAAGTYAIPVPFGETFPNLPAAGIRGLDITTAFPGSRVIHGYAMAPGTDPSVFAYVKTTMHRNLFRIPLRNQ